MAHVKELPDHALHTIAEQVGRLYPSLDNSVMQHQLPAELTETFPVWVLSINAIDTDTDNLLGLAQDTYRWHSQILIAGEPEGVARATTIGENALDWTVKQVLKSDLAKNVDDAIRWIDTEVESDPLVRILEVPAFFITALWLIEGNESSVVIAKCPANLQRLKPFGSSTLLKISWKYYEGNHLLLVSVIHVCNRSTTEHKDPLSETHSMFCQLIRALMVLFLPWYWQKLRTRQGFLR